jgi:hypothetical protein
MASIAPARPHFQQLADLVCGHAAARDWPKIEFEASFRTIIRAGGGASTLEGNSVFWNNSWDADADRPNHRVGVGSGEEAWRIFLFSAFYSDLLKADTELLKFAAVLSSAELGRSNIEQE